MIRFLILFLALSALDWADTIRTFTVTGNAGADFSGTITFTLGPDGNAGLSNVLSSTASIGPVIQEISDSSGRHTVTVPATTFGRGELTSFSFISGIPGACHFSATRDPNVVCTAVNADWTNSSGQILSILDEYAFHYTQTAGFFAAVPGNPSFHAEITTAQVTDTVVPEPATHSLALLFLGFFLTGTFFRSRLF